jgi:hypothetical protein
MKSWHAFLPEFFFGGRSHCATLDALEECTRQPALAGMAFAVHRTQVKELIAERIAPILLRENLLKGNGQLTQARGLRPGLARIASVDRLSEESIAAARALAETGEKLIAEGAA